MNIFNLGNYTKDLEEKKNENKQTFELLTMISQFTIYMLTPIGMCFFLGWYLDGKLGTKWIAIVLFFVGALAGFRNVYLLAKKYTAPSRRDDEETSENER